MEREENWLNTINKQREIISNMSYTLSNIAGAFYKTGNEYMDKRLTEIAMKLENAENQIDKAIGQVVSDRVHEAQQHSTTMLKSCLAGITIGKGE